MQSEDRQMPITGAQVKAARQLLGWSQSRLAAETGVSASTIAKFEEGKQRPAMLDLSVVHRMLKDAGVELTDDEAARVSKSEGSGVATGNLSGLR
jgi:transcriptional regulator with XRE-family HTH domain